MTVLSRVVCRRHGAARRARRGRRPVSGWVGAEMGKAGAVPRRRAVREGAALNSAAHGKHPARGFVNQVQGALHRQERHVQLAVVSQQPGSPGARWQQRARLHQRRQLHQSLQRLERAHRRHGPGPRPEYELLRLQSRRPAHRPSAPSLLGPRAGRHRSRPAGASTCARTSSSTTAIPSPRTM